MGDLSKKNNTGCDGRTVVTKTSEFIHCPFGVLVSDIAIRGVQEDSKIVIVGRAGKCISGSDILAVSIACFNSNGTLYITSKRNSELMMLSEHDDGFSAVRIDDKLRIVLVSRFGGRAGVIRLLPDGEADLSFAKDSGPGGIFYSLGNNFSAATGLALQGSSMLITARGVL